MEPLVQLRAHARRFDKTALDASFVGVPGCHHASLLETHAHNATSTATASNNPYKTAPTVACWGKNLDLELDQQ